MSSATAGESPPNQAYASALNSWEQIFSRRASKPSTVPRRIYRPSPSAARLELSRPEFISHDPDTASVESPSSASANSSSTVLYLAYGSNLAASTFEGSRGIKPISAVNVLVPTLRLTFDLPGIPYNEPCFANTAFHKVPKLPVPHPPKSSSSPSSSPSSDPASGSYFDDDKLWERGLVGVVYEVTPEDYATIIATEGGGSSYKDVLVPCIPLPAAPLPSASPSACASSAPPAEDPLPPPGRPGPGPGPPPLLPTPSPPSHRLPPVPRPFLAHTLLSPPPAPPLRPHPGYAQASARYLGLLVAGAAEHGLPQPYQDHLAALRPYTVTSARQRLGRALAAALVAPLVLAVFALGRMFADGDGRLPAWLAALTQAVFRMVWVVYDGVMRPLFGDGERTEEEEEEEEEVEKGLGRRGGSAAGERTPLLPVWEEKC